MQLEILQTQKKSKKPKNVIKSLRNTKRTTTNKNVPSAEAKRDRRVNEKSKASTSQPHYNDSAECIICGYDSEEDMIKCRECQKWAHETCADISDATIGANRESYGDAAVGYVQLKRDADLCVVKCRICPELRVKAKNYSVVMEIDERNSKVTRIQCLDCAASASLG
ncbi:hypothetical protein ILUMI_14208 [Ignelater luminosus]|uniref:PHD-type domain-containing protein n=1 Tax=Ignelater luminosus TaxID=2038154 RepID=A0A8K0CQX2_IGNLU|nr:hypothetical protein ILUMI_14208 [Ignelater luminosus]